MADRDGGLIQQQRVAQIGIVVPDIDRACALFTQVLGVEPAFTVETRPFAESGARYRGEPTDALARLAFFNMENIVIELIQPIGGPSTWKDALDRHGPSLHHLAFNVSGSDEKIGALAENGMELVQQGGRPETGMYSYIDATRQLGFVIELLEGY